MLNQPMSSPMIKTMFGRWPVGDACCACADVVTPVLDSTDAANNELPLSRRSRRFNPPTFGPVLPGFLAKSSLLMM
jgi:hypothetical protein